MRILIYGAGAVGCFLGGHLAEAGYHVTLLGRQSLAEAVEKNSLRIESAGVEGFSPPVSVVTSPEEAFSGENFDWIAFTMKAYDTVPAIFELQRIIPSPPPIVSFQNGIGSEQSLQSAFGHEQVVAGTLTTPVSMPAPGHVIEEKVRGAAIAVDSPAAPLIEDALKETSLEISTLPRSDSLKWSKLLLNMVANAIPAILDMPPGEAFADPAIFGVEWAALREALWIMDLLDIPAANLPGAPARTLALGVKVVPQALLRPILHQKVQSGRGDKLPSLLGALRSGDRRTEVAWLNGAVVEAADGIQRLAPVNHAIALTLSDIAAGRAPWEMYRRNPEMLLTAVRTAQGAAQ